jgi:hypothetical protein
MSGKPKHGLINHPLHKRWIAIRQRCNNPKNEAYHNYGGRGIRVCKEWDNFKEFYDWCICNGYKR